MIDKEKDSQLSFGNVLAFEKTLFNCQV
jgi:hypothetical protein